MDGPAPAAFEAKFGKPRVREFGPLDCLPGESVMVDRAAAKGRNHDVTVWIPRDGGVVVIRKHVYPKWLFRLPSGAVRPGEAMEQGVRREAKEETGLDVEVEGYLLRASTVLRYRRTWAPGSPPPPPGPFGAPPSEGGGGSRRSREAPRPGPGTAAQAVEVPWVSHVVAARATGGALAPVDRREIFEARVASLEEFRTTLRDGLFRAGGGFVFRGWITDALFEEGPPGC